MVRALDQAIFVADASIEQHAMDELRALVDIKQVLIADLEIDAETQEAGRVLLDDGSGIVGCPIVLVDRITVNSLITVNPSEKNAILEAAAVGPTDFVAQCDVIIR